MIQDRKKDTFIKKLYPLTKALVALTVIVLVLVFGSYWMTGAAVVFFIAIMSKEKMWTYLKSFLWLGSTYSVFVFAIHGLVNPINVTPAFVIPVINFTMYQEGIDFASKYFNRIVPMMAVLMTTFGSINMTDLGVAMQRAGLPHRAVYIFTSVFQLIPLLSRECDQIMNAQRARGLNTEGSIITRIKAFVPIMLPVVANSIMSVQGRVISLLTKGFEAPCKKTIYRQLERSAADKVLCVICYFVIGASCLTAILRVLHLVNF